MNRIRKLTSWTPAKFLLPLLSAPVLALAAPPGEAPTAPPPEYVLAGQQATCSHGPRHRTFRLVAEERTVEVGMGMSMRAMTFDGRMPGPVLEACQGDTVTIQMKNAGQVAHGLDSHAFRIPMEKMGPVAPGQTLTYTGKVRTPGAFLYHCAAGPVTDTHIKEGMYGLMIVYPRRRLPPAKEIAVVQGGIFGKPDAHHVIATDPRMVAQNTPFVLVFDGRLHHEPVKVRPGTRIRVWYANAGPGDASMHVIGSQLDHFYASGNPKNALYAVQTGLVPAGSGAMFDFHLDTPGKYILVDHDNLRFLPYGMDIPFVVTRHASGAHE